MREIMFRAWYPDLKAWHYGVFPFVFDGSKSNVLNMAAFWSRCVDGVFDIETVGQFTGEQVKSGEDIYDGDYVISYKPNGEIDNKGVVICNSATDWEWGDHGMLYCALKHYKNTQIIGNIHQNPELVDMPSKQDFIIKGGDPLLDFTQTETPEPLPITNKSNMDEL